MYNLNTQFSPKDARTVLFEQFINACPSNAAFATKYSISLPWLNDILAGFIIFDESVDRVFCNALNLPTTTFMKCENYYNLYHKARKL